MRATGRLRTSRTVGAGAIAAVLALAACGSGESGSSDSGDSTLSLWQYYGSPDMPTGKPLYDLVERYEDENPDVTVDVRYIPFGDFTRTLLQSAAGGDVPDIALVNAFHTQSMAEAGVIQDISDRVDEWGEQMRTSTRTGRPPRSTAPRTGSRTSVTPMRSTTTKRS